MPDKKRFRKICRSSSSVKKHYKKMHHQFAISLMALILEWSWITKNKRQSTFSRMNLQRRCAGLDSKNGYYKTPKVPVIQTTTFFKVYDKINGSIFSFAFVKTCSRNYSERKKHLWPYRKREEIIRKREGSWLTIINNVKQSKTGICFLFMIN